MLTATLEDYTGTGEIIIWPSDLQKLQPRISIGQTHLVTGELQVKGGNVEILAHEIWPMSMVREQKISAVVVRLDAAAITEAEVDQLHELCRGSEGACTLYIDLKDSQAGGRLRLKSDTLTVRPTSSLLQGLAKLFSAKSVRVEASIR